MSMCEIIIGHIPKLLSWCVFISLRTQSKLSIPHNALKQENLIGSHGTLSYISQNQNFPNSKGNRESEANVSIAMVIKR